MVVLGIDGGMVRLGLGAVKIDQGNIDIVTYGMISNYRDSDEKFNVFLNRGITQIADQFPRFLGMVNPDLIASETIPAGKLGSSSSQVIAAVTACKVIAFQFGIEWRDIGASTVKKELTGDGKASKTLVRNAVLDLYPSVAQQHKQLKAQQKEAGETKRPGLPQDVFDGIAVAIIGAKLYERNYVQKVPTV